MGLAVQVAGMDIQKSTVDSVWLQQDAKAGRHAAVGKSKAAGRSTEAADHTAAVERTAG